ncbi:unnamed protein product, partial [marine sediment metagenome]
MGFSDCFAQPFLCLWYGYEMGVVWHQTIGPDSNAAAIAPFRHQIDVAPIVFVTKKCLLSTIASLRYMMRIAGNY